MFGYLIYTSCSNLTLQPVGKLPRVLLPGGMTFSWRHIEVIRGTRMGIEIGRYLGELTEAISGGRSVQSHPQLTESIAANSLVICLGTPLMNQPPNAYRVSCADGAGYIPNVISPSLHGFISIAW